MDGLAPERRICPEVHKHRKGPHEENQTGRGRAHRYVMCCGSIGRTLHTTDTRAGHTLDQSAAGAFDRLNLLLPRDEVDELTAKYRVQIFK